MLSRAALERRDGEPTEDHVVFLDRVSWSDYERLLAVRGDRSAPRITYLEGTVEIRNLDDETLGWLRSRAAANGRSLNAELIEVLAVARGDEIAARDRRQGPRSCRQKRPPREGARCPYSTLGRRDSRRTRSAWPLNTSELRADERRWHRGPSMERNRVQRGAAPGPSIRALERRYPRDRRSSLRPAKR